MRSIKGFRVLEVPMDPEGKTIHYLYVKEHNDKTSAASGRILFVGNVDCNIDMSHEEIDTYLRLLLGRFGEIESVSISAFSEEHMERTRFAHVVFTKKSSLKVVLNATENDYELALKEVAEHLGYLQDQTIKTIADIKALYPFVDVDAAQLQREVDEYMREFDENEFRELMEENESANQPDADGFITVVTKSKRKRDQFEEKTTLNGATGDKQAKSRKRSKKKHTELKNFYRFQIREDKMKQLDALRKKFDEDKERVNRMKEARKFNPF